MPVVVINADQPSNRPSFKSITDRTVAMSAPTAMIGEIEVIAMTKALHRPIIVLDRTMHTIVKHGVDDFPAAMPLYVMYTADVEDTGHYHCIVVQETRCGGK